MSLPEHISVWSRVLLPRLSLEPFWGASATRIGTPHPSPATFPKARFPPRRYPLTAVPYRLFLNYNCAILQVSAGIATVFPYLLAL